MTKTVFCASMKGKIFQVEPKLTEADEKRIRSTGVLNSWGRCVAALNKEDFGVDDLKRIVMIESTKESGPRMDIIGKVLARLRKAEHVIIMKNIQSLQN